MTSRKISIGICAMEKKVNSKHMQNILAEFSKFTEFKIVFFTKEILFKEQIEKWPIVEALIIFFSNGFPFNKALDYVKLRKPFLINDFENQKIFWDRRNVFKILTSHGVPTPNYIIFNRGEVIDNDFEKGTNEKLKDSEEEIEAMIKKYYKHNNDLNVKGIEERLGNFCPKPGFNSMIDLRNFDRNLVKKESNVSKTNVINNANNKRDSYFHSSGYNDAVEEKIIKPEIKNKGKGELNDIDNLSFKQVFSTKSNKHKDSVEKNLENKYDLLPTNKHKSEGNTITNSANNPNMSFSNKEISPKNNNIKEKHSSNEIVHKDCNGNIMLEFDDHLEFYNEKGIIKKLNKPFVEKPCNGDDHRIYIYYPPILGGGLKRLFRKTQNLSSLYIPDQNNIRTDKSYFYEEFLQTDGFDIKVYTVGPEYAHAEARKSPTLDGVVKRTSEGKEQRYPINLTPYEKEIARKIVEIFKQNVCGFDILRSNGKSYVCDVNGWSFVKSNKTYYVDCSILLRKMILTTIDPSMYTAIPIIQNTTLPKYNLASSHRPNTQKNYQRDDSLLSKSLLEKSIKTTSNYSGDSKNNKGAFGDCIEDDSKEELRSVVCVFRHSDRSPKQKMKLVVTDKRILELFEIYGVKEEKKDKKKDKDKEKENKEEKKDKKKKKDLGIKEIKLKKPKELDHMLKIANSIIEDSELLTKTIRDVHFTDKMLQLKMILETNKNFMGMTRKIQLKPLQTEKVIDSDGKEKVKVTECLFVFKWGGDLTHSGIRQARLLGSAFRLQVYPNNKNEDEDGLLRLHSTYRHDLKVYSSDEGRCMKTGAAFLQGLLNLDGNIIPIIFSMIRKDDPVLDILDDSNEEVSKMKKQIKIDLSEMLHFNGPLNEKFKEFLWKNEYSKDKEKDNVRRKSNKNFQNEKEKEKERDIKDITMNSQDNLGKLSESIDFIKTENLANNNSIDEKPYSRENSLCSFLSTGYEMEKNFDESLFRIMERINNPFKELKNIYQLMANLINIIKDFLTEEELEDTDTYFIKRVNNLMKRKSTELEKSFELKYKLRPKMSGNEHDKELFNINSHLHSKSQEQVYKKKPNSFKVDKDKTLKMDNTEDEESECIKYKFISSNPKESSINDKNKKTAHSHISSKNVINKIYDSDTKNISLVNNNEDSEDKLKDKEKDKKGEEQANTEISECEAEKIILIYKRWIKLYQDFYDFSTKKFEISKIPDIYDNIKYDLIHNKFLINDESIELYNKSMLIADFLMPQEYGITLSSKITIGLKIISPLLNKIFNDLLWWMNYKDLTTVVNAGFEKENEMFSGLDRNKLTNEIKSAWRHIKTRFYFTSASHLYSLINVILYGLDSNLLEKSETSFISELKKNKLELDYCSHLMFRLYENLEAHSEDLNRFRLEIIMSPGANKSPLEADENHTISVSPWIILNKNLTLTQVIEFFESLGINKSNLLNAKK